MQNINPQYWGGAGWKFMHYITLAYPNKPNENDKRNIKQYFTTVGSVLPCESCRINYYKHLKKYPITNDVLLTRHSLVEWLMNIHNEVNKIHGKRLYSINDLYDEYLDSKEPQIMCNSTYLIFLFLSLIVLVIYYICKQRSSN